MIDEILGGHYRVIEEIGRGGFATVYRGIDTKLKRDVAIKVLSSDALGRDLKRRFQHESEWLANFKHANIVTVFDVGAHRERPYLVMEHVAGASLAELVARTTFAPEEIRPLAMQVCRAMAYSHTKGIIHRDLSLKNIMVEINDAEESVVKILDFGLAKYLHDDFTRTLSTMGTAPYLAPEQITGDPVDGRTDIFSFGVCLFRMLTGRYPFLAESAPETMRLICQEPVTDFPEEIAPAQCDLITRCLEKKPAARFATFAELADDVDRCFPRNPVAAATTVAPTRPASVDTARRPDRNPYLNRVMIKDPADFFGRRREVTRIYARLGADQPQSVAIVGERRIGKSSLLHFIHDRENRRDGMAHADETIFVFLDFQAHTELDIGKFVAILLEAIRDGDGGTGPPVSGGADLEALGSAIRDLHAGGRRLVVLMDEFERVTTNPAFDGAFFSFLRSLANSYPVAWVTTSCDELQNMCHQRELRDSPFFNIFSKLPLGPMTREEAGEVITRPSRDAGVELESYEQRILELSGRFPLYLQIACSCAFEILGEGGDTGILWRRIRNAFADEVSQHFIFAWKYLSEGERELLGRIAADHKVPPDKAFVVEDLARRGYVEDPAVRPRVFSAAFADFVGRQPGTPKKRAAWWSVFSRSKPGKS